MTAAVKERGILMSAPMVRAILRDVDPKTQTRRIVKPQPNPGSVAPHCENGWWMWRKWTPQNAKDGQPAIRLGDKLCPYGVPGDRLWVRETWGTYEGPGIIVCQGAPHVIGECKSISGAVRLAVTHKAGRENNAWGMYGPPKWRSGRFMPRTAARLILEITEVRVQRLQELSEDDAIAEGIRSDIIRATGDHPDLICYVAEPDDNHAYRTAREAYAQTWDHINAKRAPWASNPWVWVLTFKRLP